MAESAFSLSKTLTKKYFYSSDIVMPRLVSSTSYEDASYNRRAYYVRNRDFSKAEVVVSQNPTLKPLLQLRRSIFHEGVPGHHLEAYARRSSVIEDAPISIGKSEGWAVYTEMLLDYKGVFKGDEELGTLFFRYWPYVYSIAELRLYTTRSTENDFIQFLKEHLLDKEGIDRNLRLTNHGIPLNALGYALTAELYFQQYLRLVRAGFSGDQIREFNHLMLEKGIPPVYAVRRYVDRLIERSRNTTNTETTTLKTHR